MGSRLFANITTLPGGYDFREASQRAHVAAQLGIEPARISAQPAKSYDEIIEAIAAGKIKGLWVIATNGSHSWIHHRRFNELLGKLDFLVVQEMYHSTETAHRADLILPAAGWGEKDGTLINSERRIGLVKKVARAPGMALSDFHIFKLIAQYWGCGEMFREWSSPEAVFQILKRLSRGQPCDITGIADYRMLENCRGVQWPWPENEADHDDAGTDQPTLPCPPVIERRLFEDGRFFHNDGRARFIFERPRPMPERTNPEFPLLLLTGRGTSSQWHTQSRTSKSDVLRKLYPAQAYIEMNPLDAERFGIVAGGIVRVASRRAHVTANVVITPTVQAGQAFMPMHYVETNALTFAAFDPYSRQPSYKACAISISAL